MKNIFFTLVAILFILSQASQAKVSHIQDMGCDFASRVATAQKMSPQQMLADGNLFVEFNADKSVKGVRFGHVMTCGLFESIGLRSGDILLEVEGSQVNTPAGLMIFLNQLRSMGSFLIKIERAGQTGAITIK